MKITKVRTIYSTTISLPEMAEKEVTIEMEDSAIRVLFDGEIIHLTVPFMLQAIEFIKEVLEAEKTKK